METTEWKERQAHSEQRTHMASEKDKVLSNTVFDLPVFS